MSLVGADNSPSGKCTIFQGIKAPAQLLPKINKNSVATYGTHSLYSFSPICDFAISCS